jgi:predicted dehydrogenase
LNPYFTKQTVSLIFFLSPGGIILDMGIHDVDYISWLIGEEPEYCTAMGSNTSYLAEGFKSYGEYDTVMGLIKFKNGILAQIELNRAICGGYQQTCYGNLTYSP